MGKADRPSVLTQHELYAMAERLERVLDAVRAEVIRAAKKHAPFASPHEAHSAIREEFEELWDHVKADTGRSPDAFEEAIQLAGIAARYVVDLGPKPDKE